MALFRGARACPGVQLRAGNRMQRAGRAGSSLGVVQVLLPGCFCAAAAALLCCSRIKEGRSSKERERADAVVPALPSQVRPLGACEAALTHKAAGGARQQCTGYCRAEVQINE